MCSGTLKHRILRVQYLWKNKQVKKCIKQTQKQRSSDSLICKLWSFTPDQGMTKATYHCIPWTYLKGAKNKVMNKKKSPLLMSSSMVHLSPGSSFVPWFKTLQTRHHHHVTILLIVLMSSTIPPLLFRDSGLLKLGNDLRESLTLPLTTVMRIIMILVILVMMMAVIMMMINKNFSNWGTISENLWPFLWRWWCG